MYKVSNGSFWGNPFWTELVTSILSWGWIPVVSWVFLKPVHSKIESSLCPSSQEKIIEKLVAEIYDKLKPTGGDDSNFRVTLFKKRSFSWMMLFQLKNPFGGWLSPYERSGHQRRVSNKRWKVNAKSPSKNEGVAGACFARLDAISLKSLPSNADFLASGGKSRKKEYVKATKMELMELESRLKSDPHYVWPKSFWGVKILLSGRTPWGVLLIDSHFDEIGDEREIMTAVKDFLKMFDIVLSTVEGDK